MKEYMDLLRGIYDHGTYKHPSRDESGQTTNPTIGLPNLHFSHNLCRGFPLVTTREINWDACVGELRSFLQGHDNTKDFEANNCNFWKPWASETGDLGPVYGVQWQSHGQLDHVLNCLRNRPTDRRMVVSAWRPDEHDEMALPPCHLLWCVTPYDNKLNLAWIQRSCDFPIGVPFNIASYALLTHLLAAWSGTLQPGNLSCIFCDAHIYSNQMFGVREQLKRTPSQCVPKIDIKFTDNNDFQSWEVALRDYYPAGQLSFGKVEV